MNKVLTILTVFCVSIALSQSTYQYNSSNRSIPDATSSGPGTQYSSVSFSGIPSGSTITNVTYDIDINHDCHYDLAARISTNYNGTSSPSYLVFTSASHYCNSGNLSKSGSTSTFNGMDPNQTFYLRVWDDYQDDIGYIDYFKITVYYSLPNPVVYSVTPNTAILGQSVTFYISGSNLTNNTAYYIPDFGSGTVNYSSSTTSKTFNESSSYNTGIKQGHIKDQPGGTVLKYFNVDVYFPTPTNLSATVQSSSQINLSWNSVANRNHYKLYRSTSYSGSYSVIYTGSSTYYYDNGLNPNTTYYYKVQACQNTNQNSCSSQSNPVYATTSSNQPPPPTITLITPNSGSFQVGDVMPIDWTSTNQHHWEMNILENGISIGKELPSTSAYSNTYFNWTIPATTIDDNGVIHTLNGSNYKIKIIVWNSENPNTAQVAYDISLNNLTITPPNTPPTISLVYPNSGSFQVGDVMPIDWTSTNQHHWEMNILENDVSIGKELPASSAYSNTYFNWTIPATTIDDNGVVHTLNGTNYKIKIVVWNSDNPNTALVAYDISLNNITITPSNAPPTISLIYPKSGTFQVGDVMAIDWSSTNQHHWEMNILENGVKIGKELPPASAYSNTHFDWTIPPTTIDDNGTTHTLDGNNYKIKIVVWNSDDPNTAQVAYDISTNNLTINSAGSCVYLDPGIQSGSELEDAVTFLCTEGLLDDDGYCEPDDPITRAALAKMAYLSIDLQNSSYNADEYPSPFQDLQDNTTWFYTFAKNLTYLEYQDGKAPFDKTFFNFYASNYITRTHVLKVLLETWDITIQTGTGLPYTDVPVTRDNYEYIYTAYQLGIIDDNPQHLYGPDVNVYRSEVFIMLYRMMDVLGFVVPTPTQSDFFITGNYVPENFASFNGLHSGNFNHYTKTSFAISSIGIPLSFEHTYNSYLSEMPQSLTPIKPLGKMWNHTYNSYIMEVDGDPENPDDFRVIVATPNGGFNVYELTNGNYQSTTEGVYNSLDKINSAKFELTTKNKIVYTYQKLSGTSTSFPYVLTRVEDRNGNSISINYENSQDPDLPNFKRIDEVIGNAGRKLEFYYHSNTDLVNYVKDPLNRRIYFSFNDGKLSSFKDAKNQTTHYNYGTSYDEQNLLLSIQLPKGNTITNTYVNKKLTSSKTNGNQPTTYSYVRNYGQSGYDDYTKTTVVDPNNKTTIIDYNKHGNPNHIVKNGNTTIDVDYNVTQKTKPSNIDVNGKNASFTYDNKGNVLTASLPMGISYSYTYNSNNDITSYTDPNSHTYYYSYDGNGNLSEINTPRSGVTTYINNGQGLTTSITNPMGISTYYTYDIYGNVTQTNKPEGISTSATYDIISRLQTFTNPNGNSISYNYDNNDNLTQESFNSRNTSYSYDPNDNLTQITNANGGATTLGYDFQNDYLNSVSFFGATDSYTYYDDGRIHTSTDSKGNTTTYNYDTYGRLQSLNNGGDIITYTYDNYDNITSVINSSGTIQYTYDLLNRVTSTTDYYGNTVSYNYDNNSNVTRITYPGNKSVYYTYYSDNLLHTVKDWNNKTTTYTYRNDGLLSVINYPNGTYCNYTYDNAGRMTGLSWKNSNGIVINECSYDLDAMGNHVSETKTEPYSPISLSNNTISYTYNSANRLQSAGSVSFGYDANGNTTSKTGNSFIYNKYDQLSNVSGNTNAQYQYDGGGNRRKTTISGQTKKYVLDILGMSKVLIETDNSNSPQNYYVYGLGLISRINSSNATNYYHYDYKGSTIAMTNESENITHKYQYNDFGEVLQLDEDDFNPYRYIGKYGVEFDNTELYFMRARYYDPEIGRFLSEDPIWSTNLYPYAGNNPLVFVDCNGERKMPLPSGYKKEPSWLERNWSGIKKTVGKLEFVSSGNQKKVFNTTGKLMDAKDEGEYLGLNAAKSVDAYNTRFQSGDNLEVGSDDWERQFDSGIKAIEVLLSFFHKTKINPVSEGVLKGFEEDDDLNPIKNLHEYQKNTKRRRSIEQDIMNGKY